MKSATKEWPDIILDAPDETTKPAARRVPKRSGWRMIYLLPLAVLLGCLLLPLALVLAVLDGWLHQCECDACARREGVKTARGSDGEKPL